MRRTIADHGIIGDMRTAALVANDGVIDFMCWPRFDSPSLFSALVDGEQDRAGMLALNPLLADARRQQIYLPGTNVLQTRWLSPEGVVEVTDWMPLDTVEPCIIRKVTAIKGQVDIQLSCALSYDYGRQPATVQHAPNGVIFSAPEQPAIQLSFAACPPPLTVNESQVSGTFTLAEGQSRFLMLASASQQKLCPHQASVSLTDTLTYWKNWSQASQYRGRWAPIVERSALTLKLLTYAQNGAIIAAPTYGLPELPGGERNWDYRYAWVRDASFTVYALIRWYTAEAQHFMSWLGAFAHRSPHAPHALQLMYSIDGDSDLDEVELTHLSGYQQSLPVRIGNQAYEQLQLDIFGELMDAIYLTNKYGAAISHHDWLQVSAMIDQVCEVWQQTDVGIWEKRGEPQHHLHSRLMCWVALDRAIRLADKRSLPQPEHWQHTRSAIYHDIWTQFWDEELGHFVQSKGGKEVDGSMLLMPLVRFVSATDPAWLATLRAIERDLVRDGLVWRYNATHAKDGLTGDEGAFTACSFWYVECLARAGEVEKAHFEFEKLLQYANPLGLFAEEFDEFGRPLGNFPQGLSHLALISAATFLERRLTNENTTWQP